MSVFGVFLICIFPHSDWIRNDTPEYREILHISTYSVRMRENTDQKNSEYGHFFTQCYTNDKVRKNEFQGNNHLYQVIFLFRDHSFITFSKFSEKLTFLISWCVSEGKKCYFFGKFCERNKWMIPNLNFSVIHEKIHFFQFQKKQDSILRIYLYQ